MSRRTARPFWADDLPAYPGPAGNIPLDGTPDGVVALTLLHWREALRSRPLVYVARSDARAERIARTLSAFGDRAVFLPGWDCQPYDRVSPSRGAMGMRIAALHALQEPAGRVVVTTARAAMQRLPSRAEQLQQGMIIAPGRALDESALRTFLRGRGYVLDDRVDEPGEAAFHGRTIDIFPGNAEFPVRIECEDGLVKELRCYDPVLQRTLASLEQLDLLPTDEALAATPALSGELREALWDSERGTLRLGASHWLPLFYRHRLATLFEIAGDVAVLIDAEVPAQVDEHDRRIADAFAFAADLLRSERRQGSRTLSPLEPKRLYLERSEIEEALSDAVTFRLPADTSGKIGEHLPPLRANGRAGKARAFIGEQRAAGRRVLLAAEDEATRSALIARLRLDVLGIEQLKQWSDAVELRAGTVALLPEDLPQGFML
ncbi:MAG TPA: hypothetical protein VHM01_13680, partial [Alphaproteobacteria bacterium]|nr:hypothetical protein [Alphaproteobacteria bacterium]